MSTSRLRIMGVRRRQLCLYVACGCVSLWLVTLIFSLFEDTCHARWHTDILCDEYRAGNIAGPLCESLCKTQKIWLSSCENEKRSTMLFHFNNSLVFHVKNRYTSSVPYQPASGFYDMPKSGSRMEQFRDMLSDLLTSKLGGGDHNELLQRLMRTGDVNGDDKISLAEAKTLWSLLRSHVFFMTQVLRDSYHVSKLVGFCGEVFAVEEVAHAALYERRSGPVHRWLFPSAYQWGFPPWVQRAKVAVGLLEFTMDIYQHGPDGSFYLCNSNESNIGYSSNYDVTLVDVSQLLPRAELGRYVQDATCRSDDDCRYSDHCTTVCDLATRRCTAELVRPNLHLVCQVLEPYIVPGAPRQLAPDLLNLMDKCHQLHALAANFEIQHSLILNDLRLLLWKAISSLV